MSTAPWTSRCTSDGDAEEDQPVGDRRQEHRGDQRVDDATLPAVQARAAEDHGGEHREQGVDADRRLGPADADHLHQPGEPGQRAGDDEHDEADALDVDPRPVGRPRGCRRWRRGGRRSGCAWSRTRRRRTAPKAISTGIGMPRSSSRERKSSRSQLVAEDARAAGVHLRQPLDDAEHPERGDDRGDPHVVDEHAVARGRSPRRCRRRWRSRRTGWCPPITHAADDAPGEGDRRAEGDVELAEQRHHRRPDADDREDRRLAQQQQDVVVGEERVGGDRRGTPPTRRR